MATAARTRLAAIDVMRGFVMILMTIDHASDVFDRGHLMTDSVAMYHSGMALPTGPFVTRWITHLCAPTFVLLAGTALALSTASRTKRGDSPASIDRHLAIRGVLLIALEPLWMSWALLGDTRCLLQVLYAIGASFLLMIPLRRLGDRALFALAVGLAVLHEVATGLFFAAGLGRSLPVVLLLSGGGLAGGRIIVGYPVLPWLAIMCAGWVLGRRLLAWPAEERDRKAARMLAVAGAVLLGVFLVVRGVNGLGNAALLRDDGSLVQWLHVSKYPPSLAFDGLELGIACLMLAGLFAWMRERPDFLAPVRSLGQVALFYYLLHVHLLRAVAWLTSTERHFGVESAYLGMLGAVVILAPACAWYRRYKAANPGGWRQYV